MYCSKCGKEIEGEAMFCSFCGAGVTAVTNENNPIPVPIKSKTKTIIKCGNCEYIGTGELARGTFATALAWVCVLFAPIITILYFVGTCKYRCPKCKSTFLGIKNKNGVYEGQKGSIGRAISVLIYLLIAIAIIGILSSVVLVSLNSARDKVKQANEIATQSSTELSIIKMVEKIKSGMTLPNQLDSVTKLVDITAEPNAIRYHYILSNIDSSQLTNSYLKNYLSPDICKDNNTKNILDRGINMEYSYIIDNTEQTYFVSFTKDDCIN